MATLLPVLILLLLVQESPDEQERIPAIALTAGAPYQEVPQVDVLVDESGEWTYHDVTRDSLAALFRQANAPLRYGYSSATYWLRFSVSSGEARPWYLELGEKSLDHVELFTSTADFPALLSGDGHSFHSRPIRHRRLIFPLPDAAEYDVLLRIQSYGPVKTSLRIWDGEALAQATRKEEFALGIFFGILLIMVLYNLVLFASLRELSYLLFALFVASFAFYQASVERIAFEYIWPENVWWMDRANSTLAVFCAGWGVLFTRTFLNTRRYATLLDRALVGLVVLCAVYIIFVLFGPRRMVNEAVVYFFIVISPVMLASGIVCVVHRDRAAIYYLIGWAILLIGVPAGMFGYLGFPTGSIPGTASVRFGTLAGIVLLSQIGLGYRYDQMRREREALRLRIATDLHDEIGSGLTQISLYSELIHRASTGRVATWAEEMGDDARDLMGRMQDIVWAMSPEDDGWSALELRMKDYSTRLLAPNNIAFDMSGEIEQAPDKFELHVRKNLLMIFKEIVHNAVRHGACSRITIRYRLNKQSLWMRMGDDGKGFDAAAVRENNGLRNLRHRAREINADLSLDTSPGGPTCYEIRIPLLHNYPNV